MRQQKRALAALKSKYTEKGTEMTKLSAATAENALSSAEARAPAGGRPAPILIGDVVEADRIELLDIAEWFDRQGKKPNGDFLRAVAHRYEVVFGAYWSRCCRDKIASNVEPPNRSHRGPGG